MDPPPAAEDLRAAPTNRRSSQPQRQRGRGCQISLTFGFAILTYIQVGQNLRNFIPTQSPNRNSTSSLNRKNYFPTNNITSYGQLEHIDIKLPLPENLNILFVGDSVTRYQYTSLAYFLKFGRWINMQHPIPIDSNHTLMYEQPCAKEQVPHMGLIWKNFWSSKDDWSNYSESLLSPNELCDYFEASTPQWDRTFGVHGIENRYFRDPIHNNSIVYLKKLGDSNNYNAPLTFKSTYTLNEINTFRNLSSLAAMSKLKQNRKPKNYTSLNSIPDDLLTMKTSNWTEFILNFVSKFEPRPKHFIFNQGLWAHATFQEPSCYEDVIKAISDAGMISIYKTTTKWKDAKIAENELYERQICELTDYCLDLSWTYLLPDYLYTDRAHFYEPVYSWMNIALIDILLQY